MIDSITKNMSPDHCSFSRLESYIKPLELSSADLKFSYFFQLYKINIPLSLFISIKVWWPVEIEALTQHINPSLFPLDLFH